MDLRTAAKQNIKRQFRNVKPVEDPLKLSEATKAGLDKKTQEILESSLPKREEVSEKVPEDRGENFDELPNRQDLGGKRDLNEGETFNSSRAESFEDEPDEEEISNGEIKNQNSQKLKKKKIFLYFSIFEYIFRLFLSLAGMVLFILGFAVDTGAASISWIPIIGQIGAVVGAGSGIVITIIGACLSVWAFLQNLLMTVISWFMVRKMKLKYKIFFSFINVVSFGFLPGTAMKAWMHTKN